VLVGNVCVFQSIKPKAAATPMATTPEPYSRPIAIIVAAAALDVLVEEGAGVEVLTAMAVALGEGELVVAAGAV
jgi:hypothetical protein